MATVPMTIRFLAEKDRSFDQISTAVQKQIEQIKRQADAVHSKTIQPPVDASSRQTTQQATAELAKMRGELDKTQAMAAKASGELAKLNQARDRLAQSSPTKTLQVFKPLEPAPRVSGKELRPSAPSFDLGGSQNATNTLVRSLTQGLALSKEVGKSAEDLKRLRKELDEGLKKAADVGASVGLTLTAAGAAMLGLGALAVRTAGRFEQLETRLRSVTKSGVQAQQLFAQAVSFAAVTPFGLDGIIKATTTLAAFQQSARATLPAVANLAAAMGKRIEDVALVMGKALSGSLEGFESLRNEYGISNADLKKYGATLTATGTIATLTATDIDKARNALLRIIQVRFGDAVSRQSETLLAQVEKVSDAFERVGAAFGQGLLPLVRGGADGLTGVLGFFEGLGPTTKHVIALGTVGVGAFAAFSGATLLAVAAGHSFFTKFVEVRALMGTLVPHILKAKAAFGTFATSVLGASTVQSLTASFTAFAPAIAATGVAVVALSGFFEVLHESMRRTDNLLVQAADSMREARNAAKDYGQAINAAAKGDFISFSRDVAKTTKELASAFEAVSTSELVGGLEKTGLTLQDVRKDIDANKTALETYQKDIEKLELVRKAAQKQSYNPKTGETFDLGFEIPENLQGFFDGDALVSADKFDSKLKELKGSLADLVVAGKQMSAVEKAFVSYQEPMAKILESSKQLDAYMSFADKAKDVLTMRDNLALVNKQLDEFRRIAGGDGKGNPGLGLPTNEADLTQRLLSAKEGTTEQAFIKRYLQFFEQQRQAKEKLSNYDREVDAERLTQLDRRHEREKAGTEVNLDSKKKELEAEQKYLEERLKLVEGNTAKEEALTKRLNELRDFTGPTGGAHHAELIQVQTQLELVRKAADEEQKTREKHQQNKRQIAEEDVRLLRRSIDAQTKVSLDGIKALKEDGALPDKLINEYDKILAKLKAIRQGNKEAFQSPELRSYFDTLKRQVETEQRGERKNKQGENLRTQTGEFSEAIAAEANLQAKVQLVEDQIKALDLGIKQGAFERQAAEQAILALKRQQADLGKQIDQQDAKNTLERANLQRNAFDEELSLLEQRKGAGEKVEAEISNLRKLRLQERLNIIALEADAEEKAGADKAQVAFRTQAKIDSLLRQEASDRMRKYSEAEQAEEEHQRRMDGFKQNRVGGKNSPLQSIEEAAESMSFLGDFSLDSTPKKKKMPSPFEMSREMSLSPQLSQMMSQAVNPLSQRPYLPQVGIGLPPNTADLARMAQPGAHTQAINQSWRDAKAIEQSRQPAGESRTVNHWKIDGVDYFGPAFEAAWVKMASKVNSDARFKRGA